MIKSKVSDLNGSQRSDSHQIPVMVSPDKIKPHLVRAEGSMIKNIIKLGKIDIDEHKKSKEKAFKSKILIKNEAPLS